MSKGYTSNGKRISSMTHASRGHTCGICGRVAFGNGGEVSHGRGHVRHGEAVELVRHYEFATMSPSRVFLAPDDPMVQTFLDRAYQRVEPTA